MSDTVLAHSQNPESSSFTCNSCGIRFPTADIQRLHMKTEWHRYNLKRRVAELPPVTSDAFAEKFALSKSAEAAENEDEFGFTVHNRLRSGGRQLTKKDLKRQQKQLLRGRNNLIVGFKDGEGVMRDLSPAASEFSEFSLAASLSAHDTDYETHSEGVALTDDDGGLYSDLDDHMANSSDEEATAGETSKNLEDDLLPITTCFFCSISHADVESNVEHMFKRHGLYIPDRHYLKDLEGLLEFLSEIVSLGHECLQCGFFGRNLESIQQHMKAKGHCTLPFETKEDRELFMKFYDEDMEDGSEYVEGDAGDETQYAEVDETGTELVLPNGSRLGHRSMAKYWRQNVVLDLVPTDGKRTLQAVDRRLNSGLTLREVDKMDKKVKETEQRERYKQERKTIHSRKTGTNFQKHFRDEILGT